MNKKLLLSLLISSSVMVGSTMPAIAATTYSPMDSASSPVVLNTNPYFIMEKLYNLGYPMDVIYNCDNIVKYYDSTVYHINITINGRELIGEQIVLEIPVRGGELIRGITPEKVNELNAMTDNNWNALKKLSKEDEIYYVRHDLYYSQNLYVEDCDVTEGSQHIACIGGKYVPCTEYTSVHQYSGQEFKTIISSVDGTIIRSAQLIEK